MVIGKMRIFVNFNYNFMSPETISKEYDKYELTKALKSLTEDKLYNALVSGDTYWLEEFKAMQNRWVKANNRLVKEKVDKPYEYLFDEKCTVDAYDNSRENPNYY